MNTARVIALVALVAMASTPALGAGDATQGAMLFQACAACHSTKAGTHLTGPSLANIWGHRAGTVPGFSRYSDAMKHANVRWDEETLDKWLANPEEMVPGTSMTFPGVQERTARQDIVAYLRAVAEDKAPASAQRRDGMMAEPTRPNLKQAPPRGQVTTITHCGDGYTIETRDGKVNKAWEFNIRFKTDSSEFGPERGKPVIVGSGMQGDRASIVFAAPNAISNFIKESCD
jgi:cytochrome c